MYAAIGGINTPNEPHPFSDIKVINMAAFIKGFIHVRCPVNVI